MEIHKKGESMILRDKYLSQLINSKNNGFPKVITGIRRCGKSYLLKEIYKNYLTQIGVLETDILIIELDDDKNVDLLNPLKLGSFVREWSKNKSSCYVFLDEIQRVYKIINPALTNGEIIIAKDKDENTISFVEVVLGLSREKNIDLYVTGSNSKMLSSEVSTEFRDKATEIQMRPLSFKEYFDYVGGSKNDALAEYMMHGGMPLAVLLPNQDKETYLKKLFEKTYLKDIIEHNKIIKSESLNELCKILATSTGDLLNADRIANTYQSIKHEKIDKETVTKYLSFFKDSMMIDEVERYDLKGKKIIGSTRKYYFNDIGLRNAKAGFTFFDEGKVIENIVYNELIFNNYNVTVGTFETFDKNKEGKTVRASNEMDFYATKGNEAFYFQISADVNDIKTKNREIKPFTKLNDGTRKVLVINRPLPKMVDENNYTIIGLADFLLDFLKQ